MLHFPTHSFPTRRSSDLAADIVENVHRQDLVLSGQSIDSDFADCRAIGEVVERTPLVRIAVVLDPRRGVEAGRGRSEEHTSELQSLMRISYAVFCLKKKKQITT